MKITDIEIVKSSLIIAISILKDKWDDFNSVEEIKEIFILSFVVYLIK